MAVGCRRADAGPARSLREGEAGRALLGDQFKGGAQQRLLEIAVVVAAVPGPPATLPGPAHVKSLYIGRGESSIGPADSRGCLPWLRPRLGPPGPMLPIGA